MYYFNILVTTLLESTVLARNGRFPAYSGRIDMASNDASIMAMPMTTIIMEMAR